MQSSSPEKHPAPAAKTAASKDAKRREEDRLAQALRQNLKRRKAQTPRSREGAPS